MENVKIHKTENIIIKSVPVDRKIKRFVQWLNSFSSIETLYSCQGERGSKTSKTNHDAYVSFICGDLEQLKILMDCVINFQINRERRENDYARTEFDYSQKTDTIRYQMYFGNVESTNDIVDYYHKSYKPMRQDNFKKLLP